MPGPAILLSILQFPEPIAVTTHMHADMDGAAAVYAMNWLLRELGKDSFPLIFSASSSAKRLQGENREYSSAVVLDTHRPSRCPVETNRIAIIDHHALEETRPHAIKRIDPRKASTSEMIVLMLKHFSIEPPEDIARKLFLGIIYDTKNFLYASKRSFEAAEYLRRFVEVPKVEEKPDISARIASLKAAQRLEFDRVGDRIVAITHVSAHEAKAAGDILSLGADVAIVYSDRRVVVRSREELLSKIKEEFPQAGGHEKAFVIPADDAKAVAYKLKDLVISNRKILEETKKGQSNKE